MEALQWPQDSSAQHQVLKYLQWNEEGQSPDHDKHKVNELGGCSGFIERAETGWKSSSNKVLSRFSKQGHTCQADEDFAIHFAM